MTLTITKSNKEYDNQEDINSNNNKVYQINQQLKGGMGIKTLNPKELYAKVNTHSQKKVSYMAITFSSYIYI